MNEKPILSIYVATYNHENYIVQALESIRMQVTDYKYEVLVGEDCSTDNTRKILQSYELEHPKFATILYRDHNMHSEKINNAADLKRRCQGKYIIALEGDDYWIDERKIHKQIQFLEDNPDYLAVAHNCICVNEHSEPNGEVYSECHSEEYSIEHYEMNILPGQLTTVMMRNYYIDEVFDTSFIETKIAPGDRRIYFSLIVNGKIHCLQETMSAYRHITDHGSSYSATLKYDVPKALKWYLEELKYAYKLSNKRAVKCAEALYLKEILAGYKNKQINISVFWDNISQIRNWMRAICALISIEYRRRKRIIH